MPSPDVLRDLAVAGRSLERDEATRHAGAGAHDPTATPHRVLEELLGDLGLTEGSHLLDVGCGAGRVLATEAAAWSARYPNARVVAGSALDLPLAGYTHVYLFNPFDTPVLEAFLDRLEREASAPVTLVHMSDNGEWPAYLGRGGWTVLREGSFELSGEDGDCPQHFTVRRFDPA